MPIRRLENHRRQLQTVAQISNERMHTVVFKKETHIKKTFFLLIYRFKLDFDLDRWQPAIKLPLGGKGGKGGGDAREPIKRNLPPA